MRRVLGDGVELHGFGEYGGVLTLEELQEVLQRARRTTIL
jgi:hypothetical protein